MMKKKQASSWLWVVLAVGALNPSLAWKLFWVWLIFRAINDLLPTLLKSAVAFIESVDPFLERHHVAISIPMVTVAVVFNFWAIISGNFCRVSEQGLFSMIAGPIWGESLDAMFNTLIMALKS